MTAEFVLHTPLRGKRALLGALLGVLGLTIAGLGWVQGTTPLPVTLTGAALILAGMGFAALDRVVRLDTSRKRLERAWYFAGLRVGPVEIRALTEVDRVMVARRSLPVSKASGGSSALAMRPVYPVWCMGEAGFIADILGRPPAYLARVAGGVMTVSRVPDFSVFLSYARFVAACTARALDVPMVDEVSGARFEPDQIPAAWLRADQIRFDSRIGA